MNPPPWLSVAGSYLGTREIPGKETAPAIARMLIALNLWWRDDETAWCGVFAAFCFHAVGIAPPPKGYRALSWLEWGVPLPGPALGAVVVYTRKGGGHVGFVVGVDSLGRIVTRGGNQRDSVCDLPFDPARVAGYRWPWGVPRPTEPAPRMLAAGAASSNEA